MHYLRTLTYLWSLLTLLLMVAITTICSCVSTPQRSGQLKEQDEYDVAAYIWPSCHNDPMGRDTLWSEGTGEWEIIKKVKEFNEFDFRNDPYGEHDFGAIYDGNDEIFWKIDYYDKNFEFASEDPSNPEITNRVLTIYLAEEH